MGVAYGMSKAALDQFTRSLALDLAPKQVRVNSVNPGFTKTSIFEGIMPKEDVPGFLDSVATIYPLRKVGQPEEVAKAIAFLASSESSFSTGVLLECDGGVHMNTKVVP
ncbi:hypothetical protein EB796_015477 [Bugula neritina]|uniref:DCXR n=1 Tax=Bugula neritina TaxID=10212 RepID=A0A7J7JLG1_BUGNE|nr:hypothetical protein EB796_015477 [Bugula neritina]